MLAAIATTLSCRPESPQPVHKNTQCCDCECNDEDKRDEIQMLIHQLCVFKLKKITIYKYNCIYI